MGTKLRSISRILLALLLLRSPAMALGTAPTGPESAHARLADLIEITTPPDGIHGGESIPLQDRIPRSREAVELARSLHQPELEAKALFHLSAAHRLNREIPQALEAVYQARDLYARIAMPERACRMETELGHLFLYHLSDHATALGYYRKALDSARTAGLIHLSIKNLTYIGEIYELLGEYETAAASLVQALPLGDASGDYSDAMAIGVVLIKLSKIHLQLGDVASARGYLDQARTVFDRPGYYRDYGRSRIQIQTGHLLKHEKRFGEALAEYRKALEFRLTLGNPSDVAGLHHLMAETEREAGLLSQSIEHHEQALAHRRDRNELHGIAESCLGLGRALLANRRFPEARARLQECLELSQAQHFGQEQKGAHLALSELFTAQGDATQALEHRRRYEEWKDRVQGSQVTAAVLTILNRYEKAKLDRELRLLRKRQWKTLGIAGASLALMGTALTLLLRNHRRFRAWAHRLHRHKSATIREQRLRMVDLQSRVDELDTEQNRPKYAGSRMSEEQAQASIRKLRRLMEGEGLYRDPELSLDLLAQRLNLNPNYLSQILNQHLSRKFSEFVSEYRIAEARQLLADPALAECSALDLGLRAGFGAKSSYYRLFKEATGMTPVEYRRAALSPEMQSGEI